MDPQQFLTGLSQYLADQPADELLRRTLRYCKAVCDVVPRIVFREVHEDAYPQEWLIITLGPADTGEIRVEYDGFRVELREKVRQG